MFSNSLRKHYISIVQCHIHRRGGIALSAKRKEKTVPFLFLIENSSFFFFLFASYYKKGASKRFGSVFFFLFTTTTNNNTRFYDPFVSIDYIRDYIFFFERQKKIDRYEKKKKRSGLHLLFFCLIRGYVVNSTRRVELDGSLNKGNAHLE